MDLPKLIILDVDGVLTDGTKEYFDGKPVSKHLNDKDFTAIKIIKAKGINVCFMTADPANKEIARDRNIDCFSSRDDCNCINKAVKLYEVLLHYGVRPHEIWGVGDDIFDAYWLTLCERAFCPIDASIYVRKVVKEKNIIPRCGGNGVIDYLVTHCLPPVTKEEMKRLMEIDSHEGWSNSSR
jgi:3-deoxy-D-manno-octulosonate 8-phosphate phosphatase (KDO 8-P phosphatase)